MGVWWESKIRHVVGYMEYDKVKRKLNDANKIQFVFKSSLHEL